MKCNSQARGKQGGQKLKSKSAQFFRWGIDHIAAHTKPQPALLIKIAQLQLNEYNFSIKLYFKPKGQTSPSPDFTISGMHTYSSAPNLLNRKRLRESCWKLLTNPEFYDLTLCSILSNTHRHLRVKSFRPNSQDIYLVALAHLLTGSHKGPLWVGTMREARTAQENGWWPPKAGKKTLSKKGLWKH